MGMKRLEECSVLHPNVSMSQLSCRISSVAAEAAIALEITRLERQFREVQMELAHANRVATMGQLTASTRLRSVRRRDFAVNNSAQSCRLRAGRLSRGLRGHVDRELRGRTSCALVRRRRSGESRHFEPRKQRHLLGKYGHLTLAVAGTCAALALVAAHVVTQLGLHPRASHDLTPEMAPAVVGLDVRHLQGFAHPLAQPFGDLLPLRIPLTLHSTLGRSLSQTFC
jgi:hypothetical protein